MQMAMSGTRLKGCTLSKAVSPWMVRPQEDPARQEPGVGLHHKAKELVEFIRKNPGARCYTASREVLGFSKSGKAINIESLLLNLELHNILICELNGHLYYYNDIK